MKKFSRVLMVDPAYFKVEYAINPYMRNKDGKLQAVDSNRAREQWTKLKNVYETLGLKVNVLDAQVTLPDMVFAANQSFVFWRKEDKKPSAILSHMRSDRRKPEVEHFETWYREHKYNVHQLETLGAFEGNGDAIFHPKHEVLFGGYGPRTDIEVYEEISMRSGLRVVPLQLVNERFYHLDTCFTILNPSTVAFVPGAFSKDGQDAIRKEFKNVIQIDLNEAVQFFASNAHSPDDKHVILHPGATQFEANIKKAGYTPVLIDTSEFLKSGGSVFCLKMMCW